MIRINIDEIFVRRLDGIGAIEILQNCCQFMELVNCSISETETNKLKCNRNIVEKVKGEKSTDFVKLVGFMVSLFVAWGARGRGGALFIAQVEQLNSLSQCTVSVSWYFICRKCEINHFVFDELKWPYNKQ